MGSWSRSKGVRGEQELVRYLVSLGFAARRGTQYRSGGGQGEEADVVCSALPFLHFEVKRTEKLNLWGSLEQASGEADEGQLPVLAFRRNRSVWHVAMRLEDFAKILLSADVDEIKMRIGSDHQP